MEINFGSYSLPVVLTVLLAILFKCIGDQLSDKYKAVIALGCGILLGVLALFYSEEVFTFQKWVDYIIFGAITGAASVGVYEMQRTVTNPRS